MAVKSRVAKENSDKIETKKEISELLQLVAEKRIKYNQKLVILSLKA